MEKKLKILFDFQRFEKNERLEALASQTDSRYGNELPDDSLELVSAAGEPGSAEAALRQETQPDGGSF